MPSWSLLELNRPEKARLSASSFPEPADGYLCDDCGRDVTNKFRPHAGHSRPPYGPERFTCICGRTYLTGAVEWDNLRPFEKRRDATEILAMFVIFFVVLGIFGIPTGLAVYFLLGSLKLAMITGGLVMAIPASILPELETLDILRSILRTRFQISA